MRSMTTRWGLAALTLAALASPAAGQRRAGISADGDRDGGGGVPAPWIAQDPADSLYSAARDALNRGDYRTASRQFRQLRERHPRSGYVGDAYYWEAFALSKMGSKDDLRSALALIDVQAERFPNARTRRDARELRVSVQGALANLGDAESAAAVAEAVAPLAPRPATGVGRRPDAPTPTRAPTADRPRGRDQRRAGRCSEEDDERLIALNALMNMRAEQAVPILRQVLEKRDDGSVCLRRQAVFLLSQKRSSETAQIMLDAARRDPDKEVRENAVFWLSQVNTPEAVAALDSILQNASDRELQEKAVYALSQQRSEAAGRALRAHLERAGTSDGVKENIIFWLGQRRSADNAQYLKDFYAKATSAKLKEKIVFSLSQMNLEENARWLLGIAQDERESVDARKNAIFWAGQMRQVPVGDLTTLYDRVQSREIKEQLIFVYSQRRESQAVDKLMDIARNEQDRDLRKKAVFWLGQSRDPRVAQFLMDLINK